MTEYFAETETGDAPIQLEMKVEMWLFRHDEFLFIRVLILGIGNYYSVALSVNTHLKYLSVGR